MVRKKKRKNNPMNVLLQVQKTKCVNQEDRDSEEELLWS